MKDLEKALKKQAESILPNADVKAKILERATSEEKAEKVTPAKRRAPRRYVYSAIAAVLVACIGLGFGLGFGLDKNDTPVAPLPSDTYVALSINPSFGITATADGVVTEVTALNEDAVLVLYGEDFTGKSIDETAIALVELSASLGYLQAGGKAEFTVCNDNDDYARKIESAISAKINENETLSALNVAINFDFGGKTSLEQKAKEVLSGVNVGGLDADEINKLLNGFDEEKLKAYAERIDAEFLSTLDVILQTASDLLTAIEEYKTTFNVLSLVSAVSDADECVKLYLGYLGIEDTTDLFGAFLDAFETHGIQETIDFMRDLSDGDGVYAFDIELILKAEIKANKTK